MTGVGEEPPEKVENVLPAYEAWPRGYTVGPNDYLKAASPRKRGNYVRQRLPKVQKLGWIVWFHRQHISY